jgi:hypothetical protein
MTVEVHSLVIAMMVSDTGHFIREAVVPKAGSFLVAEDNVFKPRIPIRVVTSNVEETPIDTLFRSSLVFWILGL